MMPKLPDSRADNNPWPEWPRVCKTDYGQEEAIVTYGYDPRVYQTTVKELEAFGVELNERMNVATEEGTYKTDIENVFEAGDMSRGQSLVVWGIREGREVAKEVDGYLMGCSNLC